MVAEPVTRTALPDDLTEHAVAAERPTMRGDSASAALHRLPPRTAVPVAVISVVVVGGAAYLAIRALKRRF